MSDDYWFQQRYDDAVFAAEQEARMTLLETVPCDGCNYETPDPTECDHDRNLCPDCVAESRCYDCRIEGMTATWRLM